MKQSIDVPIKLTSHGERRRRMMASSSKDDDKLVCVSKNATAWDPSQCSVKEFVDEHDNVIKSCQCVSMVPTTMVKDFNNLFSSQQAGKIADLFSDKGLDALAHLNPFKSVLFIIILVKTILYVLFSIWGWRADRKFLRDNPQYQEIDLN